MSIWSPFPYEHYVQQCQHIDHQVKPPCGPDLAEWNLNWLFDLKAMSLMDGTMQGITACLRAANTELEAGIFVSLQDNEYKIKDLAETLGPVEFIETFMRRPYQHTTITKMCGEGVWKGARVNAEKLALIMFDRVEEAKSEAIDVIQKARVITFPKRTA